MTEAICTSDYCDQPAVAAVHIHGEGVKPVPTILIRADHLDPVDHEFAIEDWRCLDCLHADIDRYLLARPELPAEPSPLPPRLSAVR